MFLGDLSPGGDSTLCCFIAPGFLPTEHDAAFGVNFPVYSI